MSDSLWLVEPLGPQHRTETFASSNPELNRWLHESASSVQSKGTGRTYVWADRDNAVRAYFTLSPVTIVRDTLPRSAAHGNPDAIPGYLIGRLALDTSLAGQGMGRELLRSALEVACQASELAGGRYIVVDAIDEAAGHFYEHMGFRRAASGYGDRLFIKVSSVLASLGHHIQPTRMTPAPQRRPAADRSLIS